MEKQHCGDSRKISGYQGLRRRKGWVGKAMGTFRAVKLFSDITRVVTCRYMLVHAH